MLAAVIGGGVAVLGDGDDDLVGDRSNRQLAGKLGDGVVLGNVHVVLVHDLHRAGERARVLALILALGFVGQAFIFVAGFQTIHRDAGDGLLFAVVHLLGAFALEGHGEARVGDGQLAGRFGNAVVLRYVSALGVPDNHVAAERAVVAANILTLRLVGQALVGMPIHKAALRDAGKALHAAGVGEGLAFAGEGHAARGNGQRTVHIRNVVVGGHFRVFAVHDLRVVRHVGDAADLGDRAAEDYGADRVALRQLGVRVAVLDQRRAVVDLLGVVRGDGQPLFDDLKRAVHIRDVVLAGHVAAVRVLDPRAAGNQRRLADVGAAAADGKLLDLVTRRKASRVIAVLAVRLAVILDALVVLGGDGQGQGVIDRDDVLGFVRHDLDGLLGGIAGHRGVCVGRIQVCALVRRQGFADGLYAGLVVRRLNGGAVQVMMDGVARGVELEVQLQHQRARAGDLAGQHVVLVIRFEHVLVFFLGRLIGFGNGNGRVRGALTLVAVVERVAAVCVLIVELDGVLGVLVRRPDGVEVVAAGVVNLRFIARGEGRAVAAGGGIPASESIAFLGEAGLGGGQQGDGLVVQKRIDGLVLARAAVGVVGHADSVLDGHVFGGQGYVVALQVNVAAGVVFAAVRVLPVREDLLSGRGEGAGLHLGLGIGAVAAVVDHIVARAFARLIGYLVGGSHEDGLNFDVRVQLGVGVDALAGVHVYPLEQGQTLLGDIGVRVRIHIRIHKPGACGHGFARVKAVARHLNLDVDGDLRLLPVGVNYQIAGGHCNRIKLEFLPFCIRDIRRLYRIPALEHRVLAELSGAGGRGVIAGECRAVLHGIRRLFAVVVFSQRIAVAHVVEIQFIIVPVLPIIAKSRNRRRIAGEALNLVILLVVGGKVEIGVHLLEQVEICGAGRPRIGADRRADLLDIVVDGFLRGRTRVIHIESRVKARHAVERLKRVAVLAAFCARPRSTIIGGVKRRFVELAGNLRVVLGGDGRYSGVVPSLALSERKRKCLALEVHVQHRGAVRRNGHGVGFFKGEIAAVGYGGGQRAGAGGQRQLRARRGGLNGRRKGGVVRIVRVLAPVDDGIAHLRRSPHGGEGGAAGGREDAADDVARLVPPAAEGIAGLGGLEGGSVQIDGFALRQILGGHAGAAHGVEGDEVGGYGDGGHAGVRAHDGSGREGGLRALQHPAGQLRVLRLIGVGGVERDLVAAGGGGLLGGVNVAVDREEVYVIHLLEAGVIGKRLRFGHGDDVEVGERAAAGGCVIPADELLIRAALRRAGVVERLAVLQNLAGILRVAIHEDVGMRRDRLHYAFQRKAGAGRLAVRGHNRGKRGRGHAADEHGKRHQHCEQLAKLGFHRRFPPP